MRGQESFNMWTEPSTSLPRQLCGRIAGRTATHAARPRCACLGTQQQRNRLLRVSSRAPTSGIRLAPCRAEDGGGSEGRKSDVQVAPDKIKETLAGLDALLGIEEQERLQREKEQKEKEERERQREKDAENRLNVAISKEVLEAISKAEAERMTPGQSKEEQEKKEKDLTEKMAKIMESARKMSETTSQDEGRDGIEREMESLFNALLPQNSINRQDQQRMKEKVFQPTSFYVTEIKPLSGLRIVNLNSPSASNQELIQSSILIRGNLRAPREEVFDKVCDNLEKEFGGIYTAIMVADPEAEDEDPRGGPRVAFQIAASDAIQPRESRNWQRALAAILGLFTLATALQLGLTANISVLPKEVLDYFSQPDSLKGDLPPEIENYDAAPFFLAALPITLAVLGTQLAHEIGHAAVAATRKLKLGAPIFLPNVQLGTFGAITQLRSMARNRTDLLDVAAAGPIAGGLVSAVLFAAGLAFSAGGSTEGLLEVPGALLNGSLVLGSIAHLVLGQAAEGNTINLHPMLIAGWCGLVTTALNCLPVGSLDGGRVTMAAFGRNSLGVTSFFTYLGLGLGFLGSGLALPFGIFVLLCQRDPEKYLQDTVSEPDEKRQALVGVMIVFAVAILLPMLPGSDLGGNSFNL